MRLFAILGAALLSAQLAAAQPTLAIYAAPQQLVALPDGHRLNLVCAGQGSPTVILTAGMGDWSLSWNMVQMPVSQKTRVCGWDPAGYGYSDGSAAAQTASNMAEDLHALLQAARIAAPYVLVGHSAGAYPTLLFADRHRDEVAGMVLVDPSLPDMFSKVTAVSPMAGGLLRADTANRVTVLRRCAADPGHASAADGAICFHIPAYASGLADRLAPLDHLPARLAAKASLFEQFEANAHQAATSRDYGDMPLLVLTSQKDPLSTLPVEQPARAAAMTALWRSSHDQLAGLSRRGANLLIDGSGHQIQLEKPASVIAAIDQVVDEARDGRKP